MGINVRKQMMFILILGIIFVMVLLSILLRKVEPVFVSTDNTSGTLSSPTNYYSVNESANDYAIEFRYPIGWKLTDKTVISSPYNVKGRITTVSVGIGSSNDYEAFMRETPDVIRARMVDGRQVYMRTSREFVDFDVPVLVDGKYILPESHYLYTREGFIVVQTNIYARFVCTGAESDKTNIDNVCANVANSIGITLSNNSK